MAYSIGIDCSTQSISAIVIDLDNDKLVCEHSINFGDRLPYYDSPNGFLVGKSQNEVYSNPLMWLDAIDLLFNDGLNRLIEGVAIQTNPLDLHISVNGEMKYEHGVEQTAWQQH